MDNTTLLIIIILVVILLESGPSNGFTRLGRENALSLRTLSGYPAKTAHRWFEIF